MKTAHARFPKKFLEKEMKEMPGGTWITMEGTCGRTGTRLVAMGYKYNKKKVLQFVITRGAGSTEKGFPYHAKYNDEYGNVLYRNVARPKVLNIYFQYSNKVDSHNQSRQSVLALEEKWVTHDGYFRQWTTFVGMSVTDLWLAKKLKEDKPVRNKIATILLIITLILMSSTN